MIKFISLFLVFSILLLSGNLFAKDRRGADLLIQRTDGTQVRGELIAVKENSLLLQDKLGADVTVDIGDTQAITVKKVQVSGWAPIGLLVGAFVGCLIGDSLENRYSNGFVLFEGLYIIVGTIAGGVIGLGAGVVADLSIKVDKTIQIEGKSDSEIQEILEKLRKKARVKNSQ